ncbi:NAD(P)-dependent oxidoreductase [Tessaracoccus antarcticus]|nr:SDR family oxidoreductase [Tessaracoccus antarcticus]
MKILIFGATGATGQLLVTQAMERGHEVTAFVRDSSKLTQKDIQQVVGEITDPDAVRGAMVGQDAVVSALGPRSPLKRDPALVEGIRTIVAAMQDKDVQRLVYVSTMGVGDSARQLGWLGRVIAVPLFLRNAVADHGEKEDIITGTGLHWTVVRPAQLTDGPIASFRSGEDVSATSSSTGVSRASVASFVLDTLDDTAYIGTKPNIMS